MTMKQLTTAAAVSLALLTDSAQSAKTLNIPIEKKNFNGPVTHTQKYL